MLLYKVQWNVNFWTSTFHLSANINIWRRIDFSISENIIIWKAIFSTYLPTLAFGKWESFQLFATIHYANSGKWERKSTTNKTVFHFSNIPISFYLKYPLLLGATIFKYLSVLLWRIYFTFLIVVSSQQNLFCQ